MKTTTDTHPRTRLIQIGFALMCLFAAAGSAAAETDFIEADVFDVSVTSDIQYGINIDGSGNTISLNLDVYQPVAKPAGAALPARHPAIVLMHGGTFYNGSKLDPDMVALANDFASRGYLAVSIDYRKAGLLPPPPGAPIPPEMLRLSDPIVDAVANLLQVTLREFADTIAAAVGDQATAVNWLATNAATYNINPEWIAVGGYSAGAVASCLLGAGAVDGASADIGAVLTIAGGLAGFESFLDAGDPGVYILHGNEDPVVPYTDITDHLQPSLAAAGVPFGLLTAEGIGHDRDDLGAVLTGNPDPCFTFIRDQLGATDADLFAWIVGYEVGGLTGFGDDYDRDGVCNALENFFGTNPSVADADTGTLIEEGNSLLYRHRQNATPASDVIASYEWSTDLMSWHPSGATVGNTTLTFTPSVDDPVAGTTTVAAVTSEPQPKRLFVRVKATQ